MKLKLGTKEIAVDTIAKVIGCGKHIAIVHFIFGNAIIVQCRATEYIDNLAYECMYHFDGTPKELRQRVRQLKRKAWLRRKKGK